MTSIIGQLDKCFLGSCRHPGSILTVHSVRRVSVKRRGSPPFDHWAPFIDLNTTRFIILSREPMQMWIASQLRWHIQHYRSCKRTLTDYETHLINKVGQLGASRLELTFEDLKRRPAHACRQVLEFLEFPPAEVRENLYRHIPDFGAFHNAFHFGHAAMIYLRNFRYRIRHR